MSTVIHDITIQQGATFFLSMTLEDELEQVIDITDATARMQGRARVGASATLFDWDTAGGEITVDGAAGAVTVSVDAATTAALDFDTGQYDLELVESNGTVTRLCQGVVTLSKEVTR